MRLVTFQALIDDEAVEDLSRSVEVLVEDLQEEEFVDDAWSLFDGEAKVVIVAEGTDPRIYGPFRNDAAAQDASDDGVVAVLHDAEALGL